MSRLKPDTSADHLSTYGLLLGPSGKTEYAVTLRILLDERMLKSKPLPPECFFGHVLSEPKNGWDYVVNLSMQGAIPNPKDIKGYDPPIVRGSMLRFALQCPMQQAKAFAQAK